LEMGANESSEGPSPGNAEGPPGEPVSATSAGGHDTKKLSGADLEASAPMPTMNADAPSFEPKASTWAPNLGAAVFEPKPTEAWTPSLAAPVFEPAAANFQSGADWISDNTYGQYDAGGWPTDYFQGMSLLPGAGGDDYNIMGTLPLMSGGAIMGTLPIPSADDYSGLSALPVPPPPSTGPGSTNSPRSAILAMCGAWQALSPGQTSLPEGAIPKSTLLNVYLLLSPKEAAVPEELKSLKCIKREKSKA